MANRFKDSELWSEDWYCELGGEYMLLWDFITLKCDHAGIWKPNKMDFEIKTKFKVSLDSFFKKVNGDKQRVLLLENGRWFLPGFISYQWFNKKETFNLVLSNRLHQSIYDILLKNNIPLITVRGLKEVLKTPKEKDKDNNDLEVLIENSLWTEIEKSFYDDFRWIEKFCRDKQITNVQWFKDKMKEFISQIELTNDFKTLKELQSHFFHWFNKKKDAATKKTIKEERSTAPPLQRLN